MSDSYPISTLAQMAAIPTEARGRFLAELPDILDSLNQALEASEHIAAETEWTGFLRLMPSSVKAAAIRLSIENSKGMTWIDDDKGLATVRVAMRKGDPEMFRKTVKMGGTP